MEMISTSQAGPPGSSFLKYWAQFVTRVAKQVAGTAKLGFDTLSCRSFTQQRCYQFSGEAEGQPLKEERILKYFLSNKALKPSIVCPSSQPLVMLVSQF